MRLFSALVPPQDAVDHLAGWLARHTGELPPELHWTPTDRWHITLGFFGDGDDPMTRTAWLRKRLASRPAPRLRLAGAGTFPGVFPNVLWAGVRTGTSGDERLFGQLARAAGAARRGYHPHLTLARWRSDKPDEEAVVEAFDRYSGPWFTPAVVLLIRSAFTSGEGARGTSSDSDPGAHTYTTVERLPLAHA